MKQKQLILIGITVIVALFIVLKAVFFLHPTPGDGKNIVHVRFKNIEKITPGTRVTFSGQHVGTVDSVELRKEDMEKRTASVQYPYELILKLDSSVKLFPQDLVKIHTAGLMGERSIAIIPMPATSPKETSPLPEGSILYGNEPENFEETVETFARVLTKIDETMQKISNTIEKNQEALSSSLTQLNTLVTSLNEEQFVSKMTTLATTGTECIRTYDALAEMAMHGKGSLTRFLNDDTLSSNLNEVTAKTNKLLDSLREYGFFFHSNSAYKKSLAEEKLKNAESKKIDK